MFGVPKNLEGIDYIDSNNTANHWHTWFCSRIGNANSPPVD